MLGRIVMFAIGVALIAVFAFPAETPAPPPGQKAEVAPPKTPSQPFETILKRDASGHFIADADVDGHKVRFVVDTGAAIVALTKADATRAGLAFSPDKFKVVGRGASGDVRGQEIRIARIAIDGKEARNVRAVVLDEGLDISLLGQNFLSKIGTVTIDGDRMVLK